MLRHIFRMRTTHARMHVRPHARMRPMGGADWRGEDALVAEVAAGRESRTAIARFERGRALETHLWPLFTDATLAEILTGETARTTALVLAATAIVNERLRRTGDLLEALGGSENVSVERLRCFVYGAWTVLARGLESLAGAAAQPGDAALPRDMASLLELLTNVHGSLDREIVRKACMAPVSLPSWFALPPARRKVALTEDLFPVWNILQKRSAKVANKPPATHGLLEKCFLLETTVFGRVISIFINFLEGPIRKSINEGRDLSATVNECIKPVPLFAGCGFADATPPRALDAADGARTHAEKDAPSPNTRAEKIEGVGAGNMLLCERMLEFLICLVSTLVLRRFTRPVLDAYHFVTRVQLSTLIRHREGDLVRQLTRILAGYFRFDVDDVTGSPLSTVEAQARQLASWKAFQVVLFRSFSHVPSLKEAAIATAKKYETAEALRELLRPLPLPVLLELAEAPGIDLFSQEEAFDKATAPRGGEAEGSFPAKVPPGGEKLRQLVVELFVFRYARKMDEVASLNQLPLCPVESTLWDPYTVPTDQYDGTYPLALPRISLQYLSFKDYLLRNFHLYRLESVYQVREDVERAIARLQPAFSAAPPSRGAGLSASFRGKARMGCPLEGFTITYVRASGVASERSSEVRAECVFDLRNVPKEAAAEWDSLRQFDVVFFAAVEPSPPAAVAAPAAATAAAAAPPGDPAAADGASLFPEQFGVLAVRGGEVVELLDEEGTVVGGESAGRGAEPKGAVRTLRLMLDPVQYVADLRSNRGASSDVYSLLNVIIRRNPAENTFKAVLETVLRLLNQPSTGLLPAWLERLFLGYGGAGAVVSYNKLGRLRSIDFMDTFLDKDHFSECCVEGPVPECAARTAPLSASGALAFSKIVLENGSVGGSMTDDDDAKVEEKPTTFDTTAEFFPSPGANGGECALHATMRPAGDSSVFSGTKRNSIRFTPTQVRAICAGVNRGLTVIVGPPGTGKTDTAVQIVKLLHHNFRDQRTLLVAHSNQALNDLFAKIAAVGVNERYLLRLGMGERELQQSLGRTFRDWSGKDFSRTGRINHMLDLRRILLEDVARLATALQLAGAGFGTDCASALAFYESIVRMRYARFEKAAGQFSGVEKAEVTRDTQGHRAEGSEGANVQDTAASPAGTGLTKSPVLFPPGAAKLLFDQSRLENLKKTFIHWVDQDEAACRSSFSTAPAPRLPPAAAPGGPGPPAAGAAGAPAMAYEQRRQERRTVDNEQVARREADQVRMLHDIRMRRDACERLSLQSTVNEALSLMFPFSEFLAAKRILLNDGDNGEGKLLAECSLKVWKTHIERLREGYKQIEAMFQKLSECQPYEVLKTSHQRTEYLLMKQAKIIAMTSTHAAVAFSQLKKLASLQFDSVIMEEAAQLTDLGTLIPLVLAHGNGMGLKRIVLIGDHNQLPPIIQNRGLQKYSKLDRSLFLRLIQLGTPYVQLDRQGRCRSSLRRLFGWFYPSLGDLPQSDPAFGAANPGFSYDFQFIDVAGAERAPMPHYWQNEAEAEFVCALFTYMRLRRYPAEKIAVLTTYNGQRDLIEAAVRKRCAWNPLIGAPAIISTVDRFQGQQIDYVILSFVRTANVGHIRDPRRQVVALSRARLGLYAVGSLQLFREFPDLRKTLLQPFSARPHALALNLTRGEEFSEAFFAKPKRAAADTGPVTVVNTVQQLWDCCKFLATDAQETPPAAG